MRRRRVLCLEMANAMANLNVLDHRVRSAEAPKIDEVPKWGMLREAELHHAVQPDRAAGP